MITAHYETRIRSGFTLVELSIVLVILGLLTGGILAGQSLIRAAELRSVSTNTARYITAMQSFRDQYMGLPGDLRNATAFWAAADGGDGLGADCISIASTTSSTCNGDGDGVINGTSFYESFRAWQHLANAGLVEGTYTGRDGAATQGDVADANFYLIGTNVTRSPISNAFFIIAYLSTVSGHVTWFDQSASNIIAFLGKVAYPLLPEEAWQIDTKLDDGRPAYGIVFGAKTSCTTTTVSSTAEWAVSDTASRCALYFNLR